MVGAGDEVTRPEPLMSTNAWGFSIILLGAVFVLLGHIIGLDTQLTATISSTIIGSGCTVFTSAVKPSITNSPNASIDTEVKKENPNVS